MIEASSTTWRSVEEWATDRREKYRKQLEAEGREPWEYAQLRAKIKELGALLDLKNPTQEQSS